jgi:hypothetical protein
MRTGGIIATIIFSFAGWFALVVLVLGEMLWPLLTGAN